jgi:glucose-6-phosphate isomerase
MHAEIPAAGRAWKALESHRDELAPLHLRRLFAEDPHRFARFTVRACGLLLDYSKQRVTEETMRRLRALAEGLGLREQIEAMFQGETVNGTEGRPALHVALRHPCDAAFPGPDRDVTGAVSAVRRRMARFAARVRDGEWTGCTGRPVTDVVNIGIGGSDLGPAMAAAALEGCRHPRLQGHFVSNLDSHHLASVLRALSPETTLFVVASKTFSTQETLTNATSARAWVLDAMGGAGSAVARHFVALSTARERTRAFGIDDENVFEFWDWVGGRYSLWSAIGLPVALLVGMDRFEALLAGAHAMDRHFREAPLERNLPVLLGLLGVWNRNFLGMPTHAVLPYDHALRLLPAHLQQLEMESNGKRVGRDGKDLRIDTCPVVWGGPGNNGQHAYYQLLHQGTLAVSADFLVAARSQDPLPGHEAACLANALAQTRALMLGRTAEEARAELAAAGGLEGAALEAAVPHRVLPGNQPTTTLVYDRLGPELLGALVALYEHKVYVQSVCWGVNPFDQWGVELGKRIAQDLEPRLQSGDADGLDGSTAGLIAWLRDLRG